MIYCPVVTAVTDSRKEKGKRIMEMQMEFTRKLPTPLEIKTEFPVGTCEEELKEAPRPGN